MAWMTLNWEIKTNKLTLRSHESWYFWNSKVFIGLRSRPHEHRFKKIVSQCLKYILNNISHNFCKKEDGKTSFNTIWILISFTYLDFWKEGFMLFCISPSPSRLVDFYYFFNVPEDLLEILIRQKFYDHTSSSPSTLWSFSSFFFYPCPFYFSILCLKLKRLDFFPPQANYKCCCIIEDKVYNLAPLQRDGPRFVKH